MYVYNKIHELENLIKQTEDNIKELKKPTSLIALDTIDVVKQVEFNTRSTKDEISTVKGLLWFIVFELAFVSFLLFKSLH
ncbi:MAG: hypothetical protein K2Y14_12890 [Burkholderiales bacterium]|nr:hypothetical protein [Burkholderiales bacterium]